MKGEMEDNEWARALTQTRLILSRRYVGQFSKEHRDDSMEVT